MIAFSKRLAPKKRVFEVLVQCAHLPLISMKSAAFFCVIHGSTFPHIDRSTGWESGNEFHGFRCKSNHENMERLNQLLELGDIQMLYLPENKNYREFFKSWRGAMIKTFKVDPIQCPECAKAEMIPLWSRYKGKTYYAPNTYPKSQMRPPKPIKRPTSLPK